VDNPFLPVTQAARSTFSIDVDTASYSNLRRFLNQDMLPPKDAVRIEELINYFPYDYASPLGVHPVAVHMESAGCPWNPQHRLVRIGLRGRSLDTTELPPRNFVFLIDVSGSMAGPNRLPLVQKSLAMLTETFASHDRVAIVVYAGQSGLVLPPTSGAEKHVILSAIHHLHAGGSTNGGEGIELAYRVAQQSFTASGVNRVILATDGDFNVGITNQGDLLRLIEEKRKSGVFLTVLGYGMDNIKDSTLEKLADHGNGHYAYIDTEAEARKVFVEEGGALVTIAKDVKLQIEFNPKQVAYYRLIGYENRLLRDQDFNDDAKDGGEMGSGHRVTALYEIVPTGVKLAYSGVDPLRYQESPRTTSAADSGELLTLSIRYKSPEALTSKLLSMTLTDDKRPWEAASGDFRFAAALAGFGMVLRESPFKGQATLHEMIELAKRARGTDSLGYRAECIEMMGTARRLMDRGAPRAIAGR
jgi:Ca-activated chloride channel family protein